MWRNLLALLLLLCAPAVFFRRSATSPRSALYPFQLPPAEAALCRSALAENQIQAWGDEGMLVPTADHGRALFVLARRRLPSNIPTITSPVDETAVSEAIRSALLCSQDIEDAYVKVRLNPQSTAGATPWIALMLKLRTKRELSQSELDCLIYLAKTYTGGEAHADHLNLKIVDTDLRDLLAPGKSPELRERQRKDFEAQMNSKLTVTVEMTP